MERRKLGETGPEVSAIGLGCMAFSGVYGPADRQQSIDTIHCALDQEIDLLDTGDFYGMGHNEMLLAEALRDVPRDRYRLSVKFGALRDPAHTYRSIDTRPEAIRNFLAYSLERLGTDYIDIYRPARLDPNVPIEETMGALGECVDMGWIHHIGLSEVGVETLRRATAVRPVCDLQIEYALVTRGIEREILPACRELGIGITAYGVFSRGLIGGSWTPGAPDQGARPHFPRFAPENIDTNRAVGKRVEQLASKYQLTAGQLAVAWVAAQGRDIVPLIGTRRPERIREAIDALEANLGPDDLARIGQAIPPDALAGTRYAAEQMKMLDSER